MHWKKVISVVLLHVSCVLITLSGLVDGGKEKCSTCKDIVKHFNEGLEKTKKSNFGGGNTHWEEKSLGSWAHSETRLVEIWENHLCKGDSKDCHFMLEKHEEDMEEFWFKVHAKNEDVDMVDWLCINRIKVCCPSNTYGAKCKPCLGEKDRSCKGNGECDGEGTRDGTGKCKCNAGYRGDLCDECTDGYFEDGERNDTHTTCTPCHMSCQSTCWEAGPKGCDECKNGWQWTEETGCQDKDECADSPCEENHYCTNTEGSYYCASCHKACVGCSAYGADKCDTCRTGFKPQEDGSTCIDIDECTEDPTLCVGENQSCKNEDGTYECICSDNLIYDPGSKTCIPKPKVPTKAKSKEKEKKRTAQNDKDRPGIWFLLGMVIVFYVCGSIVQWNIMIVGVLSIVFGMAVYWFGSQYEVI